MNNDNNIMSIKEKFVVNVQKWVTLDNQLKNLNEKTKELRLKKAQTYDEIHKFMKENQLLENKIKISDGELRICEKKEQSGLTFSYLEKCLGELIADKSKVELIIKYIKENREIVMAHELKRSYVKTESLSINNAV
jgi:hypothetical protein